jgi:hypothetical protein
MCWHGISLQVCFDRDKEDSDITSQVFCLFCGTVYYGLCEEGGGGGCGGGTEARYKSGLIVTFLFYFSFFGEA